MNFFKTTTPTTFTQCAQEATEFCENNAKRAITPFNVIQGPDFGTSGKLIYDFLLVINTNLPSILHRFRNIAFNRSKIAIDYLAIPLAFNCPDGRVRCVISSYVIYR